MNTGLKVVLAVMSNAELDELSKATYKVLDDTRLNQRLVSDTDDRL